MNILEPIKPSRVFIVQDQFHRHPETDCLVSKFDFAGAKEFGELVILLEPNDNPFAPNEHIVSTLTDKLYDYSDRDYLLLTGNPVLIGWTVAIAAKINNGNVRFLQWNGRRKCYLEVKGKLFKYV